ncbi:MAG: hypothetical protein D6738_07215, partial [Acidobacteria bacterium]
MSVVVDEPPRAERPAGRPAAERRVTVEPVALPCLEREWTALEPRARTRNVFVSWPFVATWWEHFRRERQGRTWLARAADGTPVAIVPLYEEQVAT